MEYPKELLRMITPGKSVKLDYGADNKNTRKIHVLAIFSGEYVACRRWHKRAWHYYFENMYFFWLNWKDGRLIRG